MGPNQFVFARTLPEKWASSGSLATVLRAILVFTMLSWGHPVANIRIRIAFHDANNRAYRE